MTRITGVRLTTVNTPRHNSITCGHVLVELHTDTEHVGLGEMSDLQHLPRFHFDIPELAATLEDLLIGVNPLHTTEVERRLETNFPQAGYIYDKSRAIKCGVDIAVWDLAAKIQGLRVCDLLGGQVRDSVPIAYPVFRQQDEADVERNLAMVERRLGEGFEWFRVYVGRRLDLDERFLREARARFGDRFAIKSLDFSNLLDAKSACRFAERVADVGYDLIEAPAPNHDIRGLGYARSRLPVPISEHVYGNRWALELVAADAVDVFNVSVIAIGGITPARRIFAIAEAAEKTCLVGTTQELSIGTAAAAHVAMAMPAVTLPSDPVGPLLYTRDVVRDPVRYDHGRLRVPDGPGLGMQLDPDLVAAAAGALTWRHTTADAVVDRQQVTS
ncbi:mandelate racemase/muconate lactonizing enzyme family protein [Amycolatopsis sp. CA-126428]|uniref:mandelate racemase/muconate lactonizing enzyme family protein n=1 Tax=Amycolatopsis sp. CA-126428 TaxID=2073158 RepID=UPI000CD019B4|nr:enolase C-terminal domain-like protein [Amycolatopsis sp. CA-126428]